MHIQRHVLVFPKVKPEGCLDLSVLQYDPLYLCAFVCVPVSACVCVCRSACVLVCDSRYLPSTLIKPFRNPPTTASTHKHRPGTVLQAVTLPLTRCSWLRCQIKHLQIAGVPVRRGRQQHSCSCSVTAEKCWWKTSQMLDVMFMIRLSVVGDVVLLCLSVYTLGG